MERMVPEGVEGQKIDDKKNKEERFTQ